MNGYKLKTQRKYKGSLFLEPNNIDLPKKIDYREQGYVTPVKDQVRAAAMHLDVAMFCCYLVVPLNHETAETATSSSPSYI